MARVRIKGLYILFYRNMKKKTPSQLAATNNNYRDEDKPNI